LRRRCPNLGLPLVPELQKQCAAASQNCLVASLTWLIGGNWIRSLSAKTRKCPKECPNEIFSFSRASFPPQSSYIWTDVRQNVRKTVNMSEESSMVTPIYKQAANVCQQSWLAHVLAPGRTCPPACTWTGTVKSKHGDQAICQLWCITKAPVCRNCFATMRQDSLLSALET
jgi:hypothetical protein